MHHKYSIALILGLILSSNVNAINCSEVDQKILHNQGTAINACGDVKAMINNLQQSDDYLFLEQRLKGLQADQALFHAKLKQAPNNENYQTKLQETAQKIELTYKDLASLKAAVVKLAEDLQENPPTTIRTKKAHEYFQQGQYAKAREALKTFDLEQDQQHLLKQKNHIDKALAQNAEEFILKARLTALDFKRDDRLEAAKTLFDKALLSKRSPKNVFNYAVFLHEEGQRELAIQYYQQALSTSRHLAKKQPVVYRPNVATALNNLAILLQADPALRDQAQTYCEESLAIRRELAQQQPAVYRADVAQTLNNLAVLLQADPALRGQAQSYYEESLGIHRQLAQHQPAVYRADVALTLNNLALLLEADPALRGQAQAYYEESLGIYQELAQQQPAVYRAYVATTLNNLAILLQADPASRRQAQSYYEESLAIRRELAQQQPAVYRADVALTLNNLAALLQNDPTLREQAQSYYEESLAIYRQLAQQQPAVYRAYVANVLFNMGDAVLEEWGGAKNAEVYLLEAVALFKPLYKQSPNVFEARYERALLRLLIAQIELEHFAELCLTATEFLKVSKNAELEALVKEKSQSCNIKAN